MGLRVEIGCDASECEHSFLVVDEELHPFATGQLEGRGAVLFSLSLVTLPPGWIAEQSAPKVVRVYCADHAADHAAQ